MSVILTKSLGSGSASGSGAFTDAEKFALELEMGFKTANLYNYKEFTYSNSLLSEINIYVDDTKAVTLFRKYLNYDVDDKLYRTILTRISPSASLTKNLGYDVNDNLITISASGVEY